MFVGGCFGNYQKPPTIGFDEAREGIASWYGPSFHGKPSASGEPYDMWAFTAAHRTLPFDTVVQVSRKDIGKTVTVRINDRGPFIDGRIIDLSYAAARELRMIGEGTAKVSLRILERSENSSSAFISPKQFWVQAGAYTSLREALTLRERLAKDFVHVRVRTVNLSSGEWHRVQIGSFDSKNTARAVVGALKNDWGIEAILLRSN